MNEAIPVFEVFDGDPEELRERKLKTQSVFEKAVYEYHAGDYTNARELLLSIRDERKPDSCVEIYLARCEQRLASPRPKAMRVHDGGPSE
jgi:hypothetical protein